jgi:hypothetical protein
MKRSIRRREKKMRLICDVCGKQGVYILESGVVVCERHSAWKKFIFETRDEYISRVRRADGLE